MGGVSPKSRGIYEKREEKKGQNMKRKRKDTEKKLKLKGKTNSSKN
jgi:hypothetical protein